MYFSVLIVRLYTHLHTVDWKQVCVGVVVGGRLTAILVLALVQTRTLDWDWDQAEQKYKFLGAKMEMFFDIVFLGVLQ